MKQISMTKCFECKLDFKFMDVKEFDYTPNFFSDLSSIENNRDFLCQMTNEIRFHLACRDKWRLKQVNLFMSYLSKKTDYFFVPNVIIDNFSSPLDKVVGHVIFLDELLCFVAMYSLVDSKKIVYGPNITPIFAFLNSYQQADRTSSFYEAARKLSEQYKTADIKEMTKGAYRLLLFPTKSLTLQEVKTKPKGYSKLVLCFNNKYKLKMDISDFAPFERQVVNFFRQPRLKETSAESTASTYFNERKPTKNQQVSNFIVCSNCLSRNDVDTEFCDKCGKKLYKSHQ
jgi:hypothetical protein